MTLVESIPVVCAFSTLACTAFWIVTRRQLASTRKDLVSTRKDNDALKRTSLVQGEERRVLELVAHGASLPEIFNTLTRAVEELAPGCMCSILLVDSEGRRLLQGAAPSLPAGYWALCQGIPIDPDLGSCSSAAFRNEVTIAEDIATDVRWAPIREKALGYGLRACWSAPISDSTKDTVLGTFAMYHTRPAKPAELELRMVEAGAELAGKAIQRLRAQEDLIAQVRAKERALAELAGAQERLIDLSRKAGMAEVATGVLHNVGNVLNSVNVSASLMAGKIRESRVENLTALVNMLQEHRGRLDEYLADDTKGSRVLPYLAKLSAHFTQERLSLLAELESLMANIGHIKEIVATQQNHARISGLNEEVSIEGLIEDAFRMIHPGLERHQIQIRREFAGLPAMVADKHRILQILLNLLNNAKRALKESDKGERVLIVRTRRAGEGSVAVEIRDTGVGIAPENLTKIFAQGFTTRRSGHGFGLHSGFLAAQEMGGTLRVQSEGLGHGATFILELPLVTADSLVDSKAAAHEKRVA
jgi:signal transduction histidine kinase